MDRSLHFHQVATGAGRTHLKATNILERSFREVRRRTRPMNNFFTNEASSDRIMYGITEMLNKNWRGKTLKPISTI